MTEEMVGQEIVAPPMPLIGWTVSQIEQHPDDYVDRVAMYAKQETWPTYNPKPEVVE